MTGRRVLIAVVATVVAVNIVLWGIAKFTGGSPGGPASSSYSTGADGDGALAELLVSSGHPVTRMRATPSHEPLQPSSTVVVLDPPFVLDKDADALAGFVRAGGRLIAGGDDVSWLRRIAGTRLESSSGGPGLSAPLAPVPEVAGVHRVVGVGLAHWSTLGGAVPILGGDGGDIAAVESVGAGRLVVLADDSPLQNAYLGSADDARLALDLVGAPGRHVVFLESYHGYGTGTASGLSAIPGRWVGLLALGLLATGVFMAARGRRLGPPELERRELDPPRREYVESLAGILARAHDPAEALEPLRAEVRRRLSRGAVTALDTPEALLAAARSHGLEPAEAEAVARARPGSEDVLPLGRALVRLGSSSERWE